MSEDSNKEVMLEMENSISLRDQDKDYSSKSFEFPTKEFLFEFPKLDQADMWFLDNSEPLPNNLYDLPADSFGLTIASPGKYTLRIQTKFKSTKLEVYEGDPFSGGGFIVRTGNILSNKSYTFPIPVKVKFYDRKSGIEIKDGEFGNRDGILPDSSKEENEFFWSITNYDHEIVAAVFYKQGFPDFDLMKKWFVAPDSSASQDSSSATVELNRYGGPVYDNGFWMLELGYPIISISFTIS